MARSFRLGAASQEHSLYDCASRELRDSSTRLQHATGRGRKLQSLSSAQTFSSERLTAVGNAGKTGDESEVPQPRSAESSAELHLHFHFGDTCVQRRPLRCPLSPKGRTGGGTASCVSLGGNDVVMGI